MDAGGLAGTSIHCAHAKNTMLIATNARNAPRTHGF
jgi:hypothetical protein